MKLKTLLSSLLMIALLAGSCTSYKNIPYLQVPEAGTQADSANRQPVTYDARIMPNDLLTITVNATDREAGEPFNLLYPTGGLSGGGIGAQSLQKYLVDTNGEINFPTVGMLYVQGMTRREAESLILNRISSNFKEKPIVIVSFTDYKISVVGEVARPGTFTIENEKINVLQALAMAGDMTIYGKRENVKIFREHADGSKEVITLNLNDRSLLYSPNYYLQQNDVLYVEPNKAKAQGSDIGSMTTLVFSGASILISVVSLIFNIVK
ncbi:MAG: polysaccharide biosynthesis/export family protein [Paludibacteraceae bacterium]